MQENEQKSESGGDIAVPHRSAVDQSFNGLSIQSPPQTPKTSAGGHLDCNGSELNYLGATHWATILENVGYSSFNTFRDAIDVY